uniref:Bulb-type lectin domain-containing protein n=1 Tax=Fundulus heteroclitus TaxID=8078 RepID=A0A3Q2PWH0_FUNHE
MSRNYLSRYDELRRGDYLMSNNGEWKAVFQGDGNFVIYSWKPVWASDTSGTDVVRLVMQEDCNLVMYNKEGVGKWVSDTHRSGDHYCRLQLSDEGNMHIYNATHEL